MISRCTNPNRPDYKFYGERGITVSQKWLRSFSQFLEDMGERPHDHSLDRIDNSKGYSKGNCRWATKRQQMQNTRSNTFLTVNGKTKTLLEWARSLNLTHSSIQGRLKRGWDLEKALTTPAHPSYKFNNKKHASN